VKELVWRLSTVKAVRDPIDDGREPLIEFEARFKSFNAVRDPIDEGRGPLKRLVYR
jgi:hypothetical protein